MDLNYPQNDAFPSSFHQDPEQHINSDFYFETKGDDKRHYKDNDLEDKIYDPRFDEASYPEPCYSTKIMNTQYDNEEKTQNLFPSLYSYPPISDIEPQTLFIPANWPFPIMYNNKVCPPHEIGKKVGVLTPEERFKKIQIFREKKKKRTFSKRISYECRKRVAEQRIRVQGRFLAKKDAVELIKQLGHSESELTGEINGVNKLLNSSNVRDLLKAKKSQIAT